LIILGLDGATFDLIRPWAEAGYLPTLRDLIQRGVEERWQMLGDLG